VRIRILAVANREPVWVKQGFDEYVRRLPGPYRPELRRIRLGRRGGGDDQRARDDEGQRVLAAVPAAAHLVALDVAGQAWTTAQLSARLQSWQQAGRDVYLLIGGPDGLAPACLERADQRWSLSPLTLPHALVQVVLAEALYRAWSVIEGHPYHRD
jgi:23S rRNA (pseudouridine1915-N3)-methyltransferase